MFNCINKKQKCRYKKPIKNIIGIGFSLRRIPLYNIPHQKAGMRYTYGRIGVLEKY